MSHSWLKKYSGHPDDASAFQFAKNVYNPRKGKERKLTPDRTNRLIFVAQRTDGLGGRLTAIANAIALSAYYGAEFRFNWMVMDFPGGWHAVQDAGKIFSKEFIDSYWIEAQKKPRVISFQKFMKDTEYWMQKALRLGVLFIDVPWFLPEEWRNSVTSAFSRELQSKSWGKIGFANDILKVVERAEEIEITPGSVGIHLRAGDIIYGHERFNQLFSHKAIPYQLASRFLEECKTTHRSAILFGQDIPLCKALATTHQASWAGDLVPEKAWSPLEHEVFDIALLARCDEIISGESAFTQAAATKGGIKIRAISELYDLNARRAAILSTPLADRIEQVVTGVQRAFSLWTVARDMLDQSDFVPTEVLPIVVEALRHDPENSFYIFVKAALMAKSGDFKGAEAVLSAEARNFNEGSLFRILTNRRYKEGFFFRELLLNSHNQMPWSSACMLLARGVSDNDDFVMATDLLANNAELPPEWKRHMFAALESTFRRMLEKQAKLKNNVEACSGTISAMEMRHTTITNSLSWKLTKPLRWLFKPRRDKHPWQTKRP